METSGFPVLYILMRNDLPSMNPGKAMAQASHASNAYVKEIDNLEAQQLSDSHISSRASLGTYRFFNEQIKLGKSWQRQTSQGFGTVLVLETDKEELERVVRKARRNKFIADLVADPSYPYIVNPEIASLIPENRDTLPRIEKEDQVVLFRNEVTCGFVGGDKNNPVLEEILGHLNLHY